MKLCLSKKKGFTLIELMVSLAIFAFMTAFLLAKYGNFNQNTLLTNLAYDVALTVRSAQSYGLNVQGTTNGASCPGGLVNGTCFYYAYGVHFDLNDPTHFILFVDSEGLGYYDSNNPAEIISTYNMNKGYQISDICTGTDSLSCATVGPSGTLDVTFKRPIPDAVIVSNQNATAPSAYSKVTLTANGVSASVVVQSTGEISVGN